MTYQRINSDILTDLRIDAEALAMSGEHGTWQSVRDALAKRGRRNAVHELFRCPLVQEGMRMRFLQRKAQDVRH